MKKLFVALALLASAGGASASGTSRGPFARTAVVDSRTGSPAAAVVRLQPVVGSVQRTSHFTNPLTHKARYSDTVYNPALGQFGTRTFRR